MSHLPRVVALAIAALAAVPLRAQTTNAFDGIYVGVSAVSLGNMHNRQRGCADFRAPAPLTIAAGHAAGRWGEGSFDGQVSPDGTLVLRSWNAGKFEGRIENGSIRGRFTAACAYDLTWRKRK